MHKYILFSIILFLFSACSGKEQPVTGKVSASAEKAASASATTSVAATRSLAAHKIIFFLDPNGGPCRLQVSILNEMANELRGNVDIQYVQTTVPADRDTFYRYGIRALPTLLLTDAEGTEIRRMTPGVKQVHEVRQLLQFIPQS